MLFLTLTIFHNMGKFNWGPIQGFSYCFKVGARGLLNLGEKAFGPIGSSKSGNLMQSKKLKRHFKWIKNMYYEEVSSVSICCFNCPL